MLVLSVEDFVHTNRVRKKRKPKSSILKRYYKRYQDYQDNPIIATADAVIDAIAISQVDGPLPIADVVGVTYGTIQAVDAWADYFQG